MMRAITRTLILGGVLLIAIVMVIGTSTAQDDLCPEIVDQALMSLDKTCASIDHNSACYGNSDVSATFVDPVDQTNFARPTDRIKLARLQSIQTSPLDEAEGKWGLAMLNVQANVPSSLPGQGVIFILMGDAKIENQVKDVSEAAGLVNVTTSAPSNIRSQPNKKAPVLSSVPSDTVLQVDVLSQDGKWLRTVKDGVPGWIHQKVVKDFDQLPPLPAPDRYHMSPMQVFQFTGGIGRDRCAQSQGSLLIQGPNRMIVDIEVNGVKISIGSTILIHKTPESELQVTVLSGEVNVDGVPVSAGYYTKAALGDDNLVKGVFSPAAPVTVEEYEALQLFGSLPEQVVHYRPIIPMPASITQINPHGNQGQGKGQPDKKDKKDKKDKDKKEHPDHPGNGNDAHDHGNHNGHD